MTQDVSYDHAWADRRTRDVVESMRQHVDEVAADADQKALLQLALVGTRAATATSGARLASVHLPLLVVAATGNESDALGIARVTALVEAGVDLLDHIADNELGPEWRGRARAGAPLAATGFLCALPQLAISRLAIPAERSARLHATLAAGFVAMGAGQQLDLSLAGQTHPSVAALDRAAEGKTGARRGLYAHLAAIFAGANDAACAAWARFGSALGMSSQLASDITDVMQEDGGRDLATGLRTWPVAWALEHLQGADAAALHDALEQSRTDADARASVRETLRASGAVVRIALEIERHKARALAELHSLSPREPAAAALKSLVATL